MNVDVVGVAPLSQRTWKLKGQIKGQIKGQPLRFIKGHWKRKGPNTVVHFADGVSVLALERKNGDVLPCFINTTRYDEVKSYRWTASPVRGKDFYAITTITIRSGRRTTLKMHQLLTGFIYDEVDHIKGNGLDNRDNNLRDAQGRNQQNCGLRSNNTSGVTGVSRTKTKSWYAYIRLNGKSRSLGKFKDKVKAISARRFAEQELFGAFAREAVAA